MSQKLGKTITPNQICSLANVGRQEENNLPKGLQISIESGAGQLCPFCKLMGHIADLAAKFVIQRLHLNLAETRCVLQVWKRSVSWTGVAWLLQTERHSLPAISPQTHFLGKGHAVQISAAPPHDFRSLLNTSPHISEGQKPRGPDSNFILAWGTFPQLLAHRLIFHGFTRQGRGNAAFLVQCHFSDMRDKTRGITNSLLHNIAKFGYTDLMQTCWIILDLFK